MHFALDPLLRDEVKLLGCLVPGNNRRPDAEPDLAGRLGQAEVEGVADVKVKLLTEPAEAALAKALTTATGKVEPLLAKRHYTEALTALAELREPVDTFFDDVMVNVEDKATRNNRLALLSQLRALFLDVADISRLSI